MLKQVIDAGKAIVQAEDEYEKLFNKAEEAWIDFIILVSVLSLFLSICACLTVRQAHALEVVTCAESTPVELLPVEVDISAIISIESSGDPYAYNKGSGCIGLMQINPKGALADWNESSGRTNAEYFMPAGHYPPMAFSTSFKIYNAGDMYDPVKNVEVGTWYITEKIPQYLKSYGIKDTIEHRILAYNWGIGKLRKWYKAGSNYKDLPKESRDYIKKYRRLTK
jgi:hypothetical protein